jgi:uncharacterized protein (DUF427 family)
MSQGRCPPLPNSPLPAAAQRGSRRRARARRTRTSRGGPHRRPREGAAPAPWRDDGVMQHRRIEPGPGQESVWDYPRPPALDPCPSRVVVELGGVVIASTTSSLRVLETSHPPVFYIPRRNVAGGALEPSPGSSWCEFKGRAAYFTVVGGARREPSAAWHYPSRVPLYAALRGHVAFYAARMDRCLVRRRGGRGAARRLLRRLGHVSRSGGRSRADQPPWVGRGRGW